jgi:hypothetical protein
MLGSHRLVSCNMTVNFKRNREAIREADIHVQSPTHFESPFYSTDCMVAARCRAYNHVSG